MATRSKLESQIQSVQKRLNAAAASRKKQIAALRAKAADAALHWVMSHQSRISAFRSSFKGTPVEKAFDKLLGVLKSEAGAGKKKPAKKAAKRKPAAKKTVKKAAKKSSARKPAAKKSKSK
jgi:DNA-binding protein HU-beta